VPRCAVIVVALCLLAAACGGGGEEASTTLDATGGTTAIATPGLPVTFIGPDGVETRIEDAGRIVTLSGDMTEIIFALGLGGNVVGADLSSVYPEEARQIDKVGVEFVLVAEGVLAQTPTVVIGDEDARPLEAIEQIRQAGVPVVIFPRFMGLGAPAEKIRAVAHVLGVDEAGEALATRVQAEIDAASALAAGITERPRVALVYAASADTTLMLGPNSVMDGIFEAVGAVDVGPTAGSDGYAPLSAEALVAGDPEVIVTAERGLERYLDGIDGFLQLPGVAQTTAGRERRILVYEDLFLLGLGPRTGQLLAQLFADLHPGEAPAP
jgi:iron complex transport system substrate-binding protein